MFHTAALRKYRENASEFTIYYGIVHTRDHVIRYRLPKFRSFHKFSKVSRDSTARRETTPSFNLEKIASKKMHGKIRFNTTPRPFE